MHEYLNTPFDPTDENLASALDAVAVWSYPFGEKILSNIRLRTDTTALDIGFGAGFPLIELSQRLGMRSKVYGIDMWRAARVRAKFKAETLGIDNVVFIDGDAASLPFQNDTFDLIVSSTGINNFDNPLNVFTECRRAAKPGAQLAFTTNPKGHMREFYGIFSKTLKELDLSDVLPTLEAHENHRLTVDTINKLLEQCGLTVVRNTEDAFAWRFADGTSFLNHYMVKRIFMGGWKRLLPSMHRETFFQRLENNINEQANLRGEFRVTIPVVYIEATKYAHL